MAEAVLERPDLAVTINVVPSLLEQLAAAAAGVGDPELDLALAAPEFLRTWDWAGRWAMVALRPGELPASAEATAYLDAALAFERVATPDAAQQAWQAAVTAWQEQALPHLALGNLAYRAKELERAAAHYREGLAHHADDPALANNLASVLGELGCPRRAEALLRPLVHTLADDSRWKAAISATLTELASRPGTDVLSCAHGP
jgi:tetratricopeptide (TPR) repeat protein